MGAHSIPRMSIPERAKLILGLITIRPRTADKLEEILFCGRDAVCDAIKYLRNNNPTVHIVQWTRPPKGKGQWIPIYGIGEGDVPQPSMQDDVRNRIYREAERLAKEHNLGKPMRQNLYNLLVGFHYKPEMTRLEMNSAMYFIHEKASTKAVRKFHSHGIIHVSGHNLSISVNGRPSWVQRFALGDKPDAPAPEEKPTERRAAPRAVDDPLLAWVNR